MSTASHVWIHPSDHLFVVLGAAGGIGRAVVMEAVARGHRVRAISRHAISAAGRDPFPPSVEVVDGDAGTTAGAASAVGGRVWSSTPPNLTAPAGPGTSRT